MVTETHIHIYPTNEFVGTEELIEWAEAITYLLKGAAISAIVTVEENTTSESAYDAGLIEGRKAALIETANMLRDEADAWANNAQVLEREENMNASRSWARYGAYSKMAQKVRSMAWA